MAVSGGVVRGVYAIDGWIEPTHDDIAAVPSALGRFGFVGHVDRNPETRYLFADVTARLPQGAINPIKYENC